MNGSLHVPTKREAGLKFVVITSTETRIALNITPTFTNLVLADSFQPLSGTLIRPLDDTSDMTMRQSPEQERQAVYLEETKPSLILRQVKKFARPAQPNAARESFRGYC